jgi:hypothetical protein
MKREEKRKEQNRMDNERNESSRMTGMKRMEEEERM